MNYIEALLNESEREKEITKEIGQLTEEFENSEVYKAYDAKTNELYKEQHKLFKERMDAFKENHPARKRVEKSPIDREAFREENRKKHEEWLASLPSNVKEAMNLYRGMTKSEINLFNKARVREGYWVSELDKFENPKTTEQDVWELQQILVQTVIDYIKEKELDDIDTVSFHVDGLPWSVKEGRWTPSSDSSITVEGLQIENEGDKFPVRRLIEHIY